MQFVYEELGQCYKIAAPPNSALCGEKLKICVIICLLHHYCSLFAVHYHDQTGSNLDMENFPCIYISISFVLQLTA